MGRDARVTDWRTKLMPYLGTDEGGNTQHPSVRGAAFQTILN